MNVSVAIVNCLDFVFTTITIMTIGLAVWHIIDENIGTEIDWLIAILFGLITCGYNIVVNYTLDVTWNRWKNVIVAIGYMIVSLSIIGNMVKDSKKIDGKDSKG